MIGGRDWPWQFRHLSQEGPTTPWRPHITHLDGQVGPQDLCHTDCSDMPVALPSPNVYTVHGKTQTEALARSMGMNPFVPTLPLRLQRSHELERALRETAATAIIAILRLRIARFATWQAHELAKEAIRSTNEVVKTYAAEARQAREEALRRTT